MYSLTSFAPGSFGVLLFHPVIMGFHVCFFFCFLCTDHIGDLLIFGFEPLLPLTCCFFFPGAACLLAEFQGFLARSLDAIYMTMAGQLSPLRSVLLWVLFGPSCAEWASGAFHIVFCLQPILLFCCEFTTVPQHMRLATYLEWCCLHFHAT